MIPNASRGMIATLALAAAVACGEVGAPVDDFADSAPIVKRMLIDGVETVRNISGSERGEIGLKLIAEIGSDAVEEYMFAQPVRPWATDDAVYVADIEMGLRAYTRDGHFIQHYGRPGQGPGEYERVSGVTVRPDGTIVARDLQKIIFYEPDGTFVGDWPVSYAGYGVGSTSFLVATDGDILFRVTHFPDGYERSDTSESGVLRIGPEGWTGELLPLPKADPEWGQERVEYPCRTREGEGTCTLSTPFAATYMASYTPSLSLVTGYTDRYRFRVQHPDGSALVVERFEDPVEVRDIERRYHAAANTRRARQSVPGFEYDQDRIPGYKPHYTGITHSRDGSFLVARQGRTTWDAEQCGPVDDWKPEPEVTGCLEQEYFVDMFAEDGRYLGWFKRPADIRVNAHLAFVTDREMWTLAFDANNNPMIRGYEFVVPDSR